MAETSPDAHQSHSTFVPHSTPQHGPRTPYTGGFLVKKPASSPSLTAALGAVRLGGEESDEEAVRRAARQERFAADCTNLQQVGLPKLTLKEVLSQGGFGTSQSLEKEYLRLTSDPTAVHVRPPEVLRLALDHVKNRWDQEHNYEWVCVQLKSIRQDLTVQRWRGDLAVDTYETHARLALQYEDMAEFRQCNGVLRGLYEEGLEGSAAEFAAYSVLFATSRGRQLLQDELLYATQSGLLDHPYVQHALKACGAFRSGNIVAFLWLCHDAPCLSSHLMTQLLPPLRLRLLRISMLAYGSTCLPVTFLASQLGIPDTLETLELCKQQGLVVVQEGTSIDCKASRLAWATAAQVSQ